MKQRHCNATLTITALAISILLILATLPQADTAAPRLGRQPLESLSALNTVETTERGAPLLPPSHFIAASFRSSLVSLLSTEVCGSISGDVVWTPAGSPYVITCSVSIAEGATLTIAPGTVVKLERYASEGSSHPLIFSIEPGGKLIAAGTGDNPVVFTSLKDDEYGGDTDGVPSTPSRGDWGMINVEWGEEGYGELELDHALIRYGGYNWPLGSNPLIRVEGKATIRNSVLEYSMGDGLKLLSSNVPAATVEDTVIHENSGTGIEVSGTSPTLTNLTLTNNREGISVYDATIDFSGHTITGSTWSGLSFSQVNGSISDNVITDNKTGIAFSGGSSLTVSSNVISGSDTGISISGSSSSIVDGNTISCTGSGIGIASYYESTATINNNTVSSCELAAVVTDGYPAQVPSYSGNDFGSNTYPNVVGIAGHLTTGEWGDLSGYQGIVHSDVTVPDGVTFTLPAGSVVKLRRDRYYSSHPTVFQVDVGGTLVAFGTQAEPVVFTSLKDDEYGGDTDGVPSTPSRGDWGMIVVEGDESGYGTLLLNGAIMRYGGYDWPLGTNPIIEAAGAATIRNSVIEYSMGDGLELRSSSAPAATVENTTIRMNSGDGLEINGGLVNLERNNIYGNLDHGLRNTTGTTVVAENHWWGDDTGPYHPTSNPDGLGDSVSDYVDYDPWLTSPYVPPPSAYESSHNSFPSSPTNQTVAEPVSVIFGNYTYQHTDVSIPGRGLPTSIQRTYNSITSSITTEGPFGYGWTHTYNVTATQETTTTALVKNEDGRLDRFTEDGEGGYTPPPGIFNTLTKNPDDTFTLTHKDQTQYNFDASGHLATIVDKNGDTVALTYTGDNLTLNFCAKTRGVHSSRESAYPRILRKNSGGCT